MLCPTYRCCRELWQSCASVPSTASRPTSWNGTANLTWQAFCTSLAVERLCTKVQYVIFTDVLEVLSKIDIRGQFASVTLES